VVGVGRLSRSAGGAVESDGEEAEEGAGAAVGIGPTNTSREIGGLLECLNEIKPRKFLVQFRGLISGLLLEISLVRKIRSSVLLFDPVPTLLGFSGLTYLTSKILIGPMVVGAEEGGRLGRFLQMLELYSIACEAPLQRSSSSQLNPCSQIASLCKQDLSIFVVSSFWCF
jgi:hypothetical protein